jgi:hypothetical protein
MAMHSFGHSNRQLIRSGINSAGPNSPVLRKTTDELARADSPSVWRECPRCFQRTGQPIEMIATPDAIGIECTGCGHVWTERVVERRIAEHDRRKILPRHTPDRRRSK